MTIISNDNLKQSIVRFINTNTLLVSWTKYDAFQKSADLKNINDEIERYDCSAWYNFQVKSKREKNCSIALWILCVWKICRLICLYFYMCKVIKLKYGYTMYTHDANTYKLYAIIG